MDVFKGRRKKLKCLAFCKITVQLLKNMKSMMLPLMLFTLL